MIDRIKNLQREGVNHQMDEFYVFAQVAKCSSTVWKLLCVKPSYRLFFTKTKLDETNHPTFVEESLIVGENHTTGIITSSLVKYISSIRHP